MKKIFIYIFGTIAIVYPFMGFAKHTLARPYYFNIVYGDNLDYLKNHNYERWLHYMNQNKFTWGFGLIDNDGNYILKDNYKNIGVWNSSLDYPWYVKVNDVLKSTNEVAPWADSFPSGHITEVIFSWSIIYVIGLPAIKEKKKK